jgi:uncharacterized membrane protein
MSSNKQQKREIQQVKSGGKLVAEKYSEIVRIAPLPPVEELTAYENLYPGASKLIIDAFVKQGEHRMFLEKSYMNSQVKSTPRGQWFAFLLGIINIIAGSLVQIFGKNDFVGIAQTFGGLILLLGIYVYNDIRKKQEMDRKGKVMKN